ncbi:MULTISPECIES: RNA repair domain-containing protein [unclassified Saccharothrix]|uniref:RNA repair domain-containing protein n=1 Tax=unclassified Saccharothrix TaxID=2593673 RepID=UPI00307D1FDC
MRTSEEVYHRVRWDARFDPARFVLGVAVRGAAPKRVPLPSFVPGGDVPWHRVLFVEADGELVWDRATGLDRVDTSGAGRARVARRLRAPFFTASRTFSWDGGWRPGGGDGVAPARLRVLTWNTLWDRFDRDRIDTARRRPLLLAELARADADVIALQEVERDLLTMLLAEPWVQERYAVDVDPAGRDVEECGLLLLSRVPVLEAGRHALGPHKAVTALVLDTAAGPVVVAGTHLTSDHSGGDERRAAELADLADGLSEVDCPVVLVGDFNDGGDAPVRVLGVRDAWLEVRGTDTPTFDPVANPLAAVSSLSGRAARLDRVFLRGDVGARRAVLRGTTDFVSDHYGVEVDVEVGEPVVSSHRRHALPGVEPRGADEAAPVVVPGAVVHVVGSRRMGCALAGADLDLVAVVPGVADLRRVVVPGATRVRPVVGARVPGLRMRVGGTDVDLAVVGSGDVEPESAVDRRLELDPAAAVALSAVSDAEAVVAFVGERYPEFRWLALRVKAWARARGLDSAPHGGVPGLGWAVLAARTVVDAPERTDLLADFFGTWAAWDWRDQITISSTVDVSTTVSVVTPSAPHRLCTEQVGEGMRDLLTQELYDAWEVVRAGGEPWAEGPPLHRRHAAWAVVTAPEASTGRVRGRLRALLAALEAAGVRDAHAWPHPTVTDDGTTHHAIGLGRTPSDRDQLRHLARDWTRGLPGVAVEWADGGTITVTTGASSGPGTDRRTGEDSRR